MQLAIMQLWEAGFFMIPFSPGEPLLFGAFWAVLLIGFLIQLLLLKKCRSWGRWSFAAVCAIGLAAGEVLCQIITGWDLLAAMLLYALFLTLLFGCGISFLWQHLRKKHQFKFQ